MKNSTSPPPPYPSGPGRIFLLLSASEFCLYLSMSGLTTQAPTNEKDFTLIFELNPWQGDLGLADSLQISGGPLPGRSDVVQGRGPSGM